MYHLGAIFVLLMKIVIVCGKKFIVLVAFLSKFYVRKSYGRQSRIPEGLNNCTF